MTRVPFEKIPAQLMECMLYTENHIKSFVFIDRSTVELLFYYVSIINHCAYCIDMHFKEAIAAGENEQRLYSVICWRETSYYTPEEQALLAWTESMTLLKNDDSAKQIQFQQLREYFTQEDIANVTLMITQINSWNRLTKACGFEPGSYQVKSS